MKPMRNKLHVPYVSFSVSMALFLAAFTGLGG